MSLMRWDPFRDLLTIQDEMNQAFRRVLGQITEGPAPETRAMWAPPLDISERKDAYVVTVEVPGVKPEELDVTLEDNNTLTIRGERRFAEETSDQQYHRVERRYGAFRRTVNLPSKTKPDEIKADFRNGVLEITVPKAEEARPRKIEIGAGSAA